MAGAGHSPSQASHWQSKSGSPIVGAPAWSSRRQVSRGPCKHRSPGARGTFFDPLACQHLKADRAWVIGRLLAVWYQTGKPVAELSQAKAGRRCARMPAASPNQRFDGGRSCGGSAMRANGFPFVPRERCAVFCPGVESGTRCRRDRIRPMVPVSLGCRHATCVVETGTPAHGARVAVVSGICSGRVLPQVVANAGRPKALAPARNLVAPAKAPDTLGADARITTTGKARPRLPALWSAAIRPSHEDKGFCRHGLTPCTWPQRSLAMGCVCQGSAHRRPVIPASSPGHLTNSQS